MLRNSDTCINALAFEDRNVWFVVLYVVLSDKKCANAGSSSSIMSESLQDQDCDRIVSRWLSCGL